VNVILLEPGELNETGEVRLIDTRAVHLLTVLRVAAGQTVRVGLVDGPLGTG
jgi:16S rRNA (uracil1498-N3)-methyltransferase